jgi:TIR domain/SIR2-like domain
MNTSSFWDDLLEYVEDGRVIPILGPDLLSIRQPGGEKLLLRFAAEKLAERLSIPVDNMPQDDGLNHVVYRYLEKGGRREDIYPQLRRVMKDLQLPTPEPLKKLAQIRHFNLYVTMTFDLLLEQALNEERFGGAPKTQTLAYAPNNVQDLPCEMAKLERPTVYHLLGRLSASPDYAITEEDTLEFLYSMQAEAKRPHLLFDELKSKNLLIIGSSFPDWLLRFFIRIAKSGRLSTPRDAREILVDESLGQDKSLVLFLRHFSYRTQFFEGGGAAEFVDEFLSRYKQRHPTDERVSPDSETRAERGVPDMQPGSIFLSYASEDVAAVRKIRDALEGVGLDVWFDKRQLEWGDDFGAKIKRNIRGCSFFAPVISASTQKRSEGYFRLEWKLAAERAMQISDTVPFILPIALDETNDSVAAVPDKFKEVQWTRLTADRVFSELTNRMVQLVREYRKHEKGLT